MNESFLFRFRTPKGPLHVLHADDTGIVFDEPDPTRRTMSLEFDGDSTATKARLNGVRQIKGWPAEIFLLKRSVADGGLLFEGIDQDALPSGAYWTVVQLADMKVKKPTNVFELKNGKQTEVIINLEPDTREVVVDLSTVDPEIDRILSAPGTLDGASVREWLETPGPRPSRKACLLNLMARTRSFPSVADPIVTGIRSIFVARPDRIFAEVDEALYARVSELAISDDDQHFWREGEPHAAIHRELLAVLPEADKFAFRLDSFRGEGPRSVQLVFAVPPPPAIGRRHYADIDIDAANPLQDIVGFLIHMGELLDGKPTDHLAMWKQLNKPPTKQFLYYRVVDL